MTMEKVSSKEYAVGGVQTFLCCLLILCLLPTSLYAQDFSLELMKCRASLDMVIVEAGPKYHKIKAQANAISETIERLREELNCHSERSEESRSDSHGEVSFRRRIACIRLSIKALEAEVKSLFIMGIII